MSQSKLVFTLAGPDRRGLIGDIAAIIKAHDGNWVDSSLARLAGAIAGVIEVSVGQDQGADLTKALGGLSASHGLVMARLDAPEPSRTGGQRVVLSLSCVDRAGIIADLAAALAATGAVFETLETSADHGSMSGEMLFSADALVWMPDGLTTEALSQACEDLSPDLIADIELVD